MKRIIKPKLKLQEFEGNATEYLYWREMVKTAILDVPMCLVT